MAATIQTIQKPTRARALDISTSEQETYDIQTDGTFTATDETNWTIGTGVSISGNYMVFEDVGGNTGNAVQGYNGTALRGAGARGISSGDRYRVQATISDPASGSFDGQVRITLYAAGRDNGGNGGAHYGATSYATSAGTIDEIISINTKYTGGYNDAIVISSADDPGDYRVSNLKVTKLESFGNNNHGQIYSGRALEFDGVSDYLSVNGGSVLTLVDYSAGTTNAERAWTVATWFRFDSAGTTHQHILGNETNNAIGYMSVTSAEMLGVWDMSSSWIQGSTALDINTWYRGAIVFDGDNTITIYVNGVQTATGTISTSGAHADLAFKWIGDWDPTHATRRQFPGALSDLQCWQGAWTADDVLYDYNNPEQLALNRGSTSLTNSNLKAWYPMNDGHRGQQSYILDASNTGLGDELLTNGNFNESAVNPSTGTHAGWTFSTPSNAQASISDGKLTMSITNTGGSAGDRNAYVHQDVTVLGQNYKCIIDIESQTADDFVLRVEALGATPMYANDLGPGVHEFYFTAATDTRLVFRLANNNSPSGTGNIVVNSISVKPVNEKNHATTVFYGDELVVGNDYNFQGSGNWTAAGSATITPNYDSGDVGYASTLRMQAGTTGYGRAALDQSDLNSVLVAGRTYLVTFKYKFINNTDMTHDAYVNIGNDVKQNIVRTNTSWTEYSDTFTAKDSVTSVKVYCQGDSGHADNEMLLDAFSIKEVGTATGWTEADQQLDIPQTALQSYNQLAWFPGVDPGTDYDVDCGSGSDIDDIFDGGGTVSAWIYPVDNGAAASGRIINKASGTEPTAGWYIRVSDGDSTSCKLALDTKFSSVNGEWISDNRVIKYGQWTHVAINWNDDSDSNNATFFVNGESVALTENGNSTGSYSSDSGRDLLIGNDESGVKTFHGVITEVSLWDVGLSTAQVQELYNDGKALDATTHSLSPSTGTNNLKGYWRNNGKAPWIDLSGNGNNGNSNNLIESILITPGVDGSRDSQGFIMNRQKTTNSLNFYTPLHLETTAPSLKEAPYVLLPKAPLMTDSTAVTNFSICAWVKYNRTPNQANAQSVIYDDVQETNGTSYPKGLKLFIGNDNVLKCHVWHGYDNSTTKDFIYSQYDLDNIDNATITDPHSFGADGMWNGTQTSMAESKGIAYPADDMLSGSFPPDKWFHIAVTFDHDNNEGATNETANPSSNITVCAPFYTYVNGILVAKNGIDGNDDEAVVDGDDKTMQGIADHAAIIGSDMMGTLPKPGNNVNDTHGEIDELLMYSDTLTSKEVLRIYNAGKRSHK